MFEDNNDVEQSNEYEAAAADYIGTVFIIPLSTPLPQGLEADEALLTGSLLTRLQPLGHDPEGDYSLVAVSGSELLDLERAWPALVTAKKTAVLTDLPAGTYDLLFSQAKRAIGLRSVDWPSIEHAMIERSTVAQRTRDTKPWVADDQERESQDSTHESRPKGKAKTLSAASKIDMPEPEGCDDED
jgi:hypothetical protein